MLTVLQYLTGPTCYKCQKLGACSCHWKNLFSTSVSHNFSLWLEFKVFLLSVYNFLSVSSLSPTWTVISSLIITWKFDLQMEKREETCIFFVDIVVVLSFTDNRYHIVTYWLCFIVLSLTTSFVSPCFLMLVCAFNTKMLKYTRQPRLNNPHPQIHFSRRTISD